MIHRCPSFFARPAVSVLSAAALLVLSTGCAVQPTATPGTLASIVPAFSGNVHGGQQPISGSVIGIYAAGNTGYGSGYSPAPALGVSVAPTNLVLTTVTTNSGGGFTLPTPIICPSATTPIYLTATGGNPAGSGSTTINNTAITEVAALGPCGNLTSTTFIQVNEVTTVAAAFALGQFFGGFGTKTDAIGATSTNQNGLINAFATAHNLVNTSTGVATATTTPAAGTNYFLTTLDSQKLYSMANIIAACINQTASTATPCSTLFADVTPYYAPMSTSVLATAPVDTFQAAVYLSLNPTSNSSQPIAVNGAATSNSASNMAALLGLQSAFQPYGGGLTAATTDWTLAISYKGTNVLDGSSVAVDGNGDIWMSVNTGLTTTSGVVQLNGGTGTNGGTAGVAGGVINFYNDGGLANGTRQVAIDKESNAWWAGYNDTILLRTTGAGVTTRFALAGSSLAPYAVAVDGNDLVTFTTGGSTLQVIPAASAAGTTPTTGSPISSVSAASLAITQGTASPLVYAPTKNGANVFEYTSAATPVATAASAATGNTGIADGVADSLGAAVDGNNAVWIVNQAANGPLVSGTGSSFPVSSSVSCLQTPQFVAVDGGNNIWVSNTNNSASTSENGISATVNGVCEFNNAGTLISSGIGFGPHGISSARGIAVDLSGNVWVTSYFSTVLTEIVGAAIPTYAPLSLALANSKVGTRP